MPYKDPKARLHATQKWLAKMTPEDRAARYRAYSLMHKFGITPEQYDAMYDAQGGVCKICKQPETAKNNRATGVRMLNVDHSHKTNEVRGLLCSRCNTGLAYIETDGWLVEAVRYLQRKEKP